MKRGLALIACGFLVAVACTNRVSAESAAAPTASPAAGLAPEFGPSVTFDAQDPPVQLADLRGKMVIVLFFQSWCPICNGWSPELLKQMTDAHGDDRSVALVALYTDGSAAEGKQYLKGKGADLSKWIVAADVGGTYYQRVSGGNALYGYAIIDPDGRLADKGKAGSYFNRPGGKAFVLADKGVRTKHGGSAQPILPAAADYGPELAPVVRVVEAGNFRMGFKGVKLFADKPKTKDAAGKLRDDLTAALSTRVTAWTAALTGSDPVAKYEAYRNLRAVSAMSDVEPGKAAKAALATVKADKELAKEEKAESAYWAMFAKAMQFDLDQRRTQLSPALKQFAAAHKGTVYAERAAAEAETIASAPAK
jgi:cytochrome oxidase Cu insertion factor (SCO1/SenC/PrrC family)